MTYKLSKEFKDFMIALKGWVDAGCPEPTEEQMISGMGFRKYDSICFQSERWTNDDKVLYQIDYDLKYLFIEEFGQSTFPFNEVDEHTGNAADYDKEIDEETHYQNPARVKWINDIVASFEEKK